MKRTLSDRAANLRHFVDTQGGEKSLCTMIEENEYGKKREKFREEIKISRRLMAKHARK